MSDAVATAQRQQARQEGFIVRVITLPFRLAGMLCGSLLLSIVIECVGMVWLWPEQGWHHAREMLNYELDQFSVRFTASVVVAEPERDARRLVETVHTWVFVKTGLQDTIERPLEQASTRSRSSGVDARYYVNQAYAWAQRCLIAAAFTVLVFVVRLVVLALMLPLFVLAALTGLIDGLVRRDVRRFCAGHESAFVYHRAKAMLAPLSVLPCLAYLALPVSIHPLVILLPSAALLGFAVAISAASFKKYL